MISELIELVLSVFTVSLIQGRVSVSILGLPMGGHKLSVVLGHGPAG